MGARSKKYLLENVGCKAVITLIVTYLCACGAVTMVAAQPRDSAANASLSIMDARFIKIGTIKPRSTFEIQSSNWLLGCETLDRDMADFDAYKLFLSPLGIKRLRFQAGWAKTEKTKGVYDWKWLDKIINDALAHGCEPWLETSYGNPIYAGGGGINLSAGIPSSKEALQAWDQWVTAMVVRYKDKVKEWEVWNEPNFGDNDINQPDAVAELNIRTATIIKRIQPAARISGLSMGHIDLKYADDFFKYIAGKKKMHLFDNMTYHDYVYNPDANYSHVDALKRVLAKYSTTVKLRQGENGSPSLGGGNRGALGDYDWSELKQAKWNTRRMLGDLGHDIECSILGIIDMNYPKSGPITQLNVKGLIQSDSTMRAIKPKMAYYAMQHVAAIFDNKLGRIKELHPTYNSNKPLDIDEVKYNISTDRSMAFYGYQNIATGKQLFTVWMDENIPTGNLTPKEVRLTLTGANIDQPVLVDLLSGNVYELSTALWRKDGNKLIIDKVPVYDAPVLIADKSLIVVQ